MSKRLKLRIEPFVKALVVQVIDMEGDFKSTAHVVINHHNMPYLRGTGIGLYRNSDVSVREFMTDEKRDAYASQLLDWISDELFGGTWKLEVGKMCEVSDDGKTWVKRIYVGKILYPLNINYEFLTRCEQHDEVHYLAWRYARPLSAQPTIDGNVYTWEAD